MSDNLGAYIARLIELGVPAVEAACIAAEIFVAGVQASAYRTDVKPRTANAERQARFRANRANGVTGVTSNVTSVTSNAPPSPKDPQPSPTTVEVSHTPSPIPLPQKEPLRGSKKGVRLAPDWEPTEAHWAKAREMGFSEAQAQRQFDRFRDFWIAKPGKDGVKLDWDATLRNWLRTEADRSGIAPAPPPRAGPPLPPRKIYTDEELLADVEPDDGSGDEGKFQGDRVGVHRAPRGPHADGVRHERPALDGLLPGQGHADRVHGGAPAGWQGVHSPLSAPSRFRP